MKVGDRDNAACRAHCLETRKNNPALASTHAKDFAAPGGVFHQAVQFAALCHSQRKSENLVLHTNHNPCMGLK